jgi:hypothetical protein
MSAGVFEPVDNVQKKSYPGHLKLMQDLKTAKSKLDVGKADPEKEERVPQKPRVRQGERTARSS